MSNVLQIDDVQLSSDDIITQLKFKNEFEQIANQIINDKLTVLAAKRRGMDLSNDELQQSCDDFRRYAGLHRAKETQEWLDELNISIDDFEAFVSDLMLINKMKDEITSGSAIDDYFALHSPEFQTVDLKHMVIVGEEKVKEIMALLDDDPEMFDELVYEHSLDENTVYNQGLMKKVRRSTLLPEVAAKVFNASAGDIVGPIQLDGEDIFEVVFVIDLQTPNLTEDIREEVAKSIYNEWLAERVKEATIFVR